MPEIKNNFLQGKMNKDLDERLIPNGQYRHAENVEVSTAEDAGVGVVKNILGNKRVEDIIPPEFKCVGSIADEKNNKLYWFITTYGKDAIIEYDAQNDITSPVIVDKNAGNYKAVLKFSGNIITGINIIDNLLFWTDDRSDPKKINIDECKAGTAASITSLNEAFGPLNELSNVHTQLLFENGSFDGITIQLVSKIADVPYYGKEGKWFWFEQKHLEKIFLPFGPNSNQPFHYDDSKYASGDPYLIRHYRSGKFLGLKRLTIWGIDPLTGVNLSSYGTFAKIHTQSTDEDWYAGDVIFGVDINLDIEERHITVIKPKPLNTFSVKINHSPNLDSTSNIPNLFETKFPRFSYRYKYRDGEFSAFAPFTDPVFNPKYTKDPNKSSTTNVLYDQNTAYDIKEPQNKAMVNSIHSIELSDFITAQTPEDVIEIDILYKQEDSPVIYSIGTIVHLDEDWHKSSLHEGLGANIGIGKANLFGDGFEAMGGYTKGKYTVTTENIYAALPANQLLRPWDNVPRKALAQEIVGNRIVYGNYLQNYDIGVVKPEIKVSYSDRSNQIGSFSTQGLPSIKSQRNYQLGVIYCDKYGRETPVFTSDSGAISIPWQEGDGTKNASKSLQINTNVAANFPEWVDSLKFFVKETSNEYYNLVMDRAWVMKSTYELDNSEGHLWISFPSSDRNKISEEDYIILKKKVGVGEEQVNFENKFKVIDIKNEAPDAIKYQLVNQGVMSNNSSDTFTTGADVLFPVGGGKMQPDIVGGDTIVIDFSNWKGTSSQGYRAALEHADVDDGGDRMGVKGLYVSWRRLDSTGVGVSSKKYKVVEGGFKGTTKYVLKLSTPITQIDADIAHVNGVASETSTNINLHPALIFQVEKKELKDTEDFSGKFFVKISKNQVTDLIESGEPVNLLDQYQISAKTPTWYWQDQVGTIQTHYSDGNPSGNFGLTNWEGSDNGAATSGANSILNGANNVVGPNTGDDPSFDAEVTDHSGMWDGILSTFKPTFFVDAMYMASGQSEVSNYAKYNCVTWSGCTMNDDNETAEDSAWSYAPFKTWLTDFKDSAQLLENLESDSENPTWYNGNLITTSPLVTNDNPDWNDLKVDGWVGSLQNVNRTFADDGLYDQITNLTHNHINGLEGIVTTSSFHATGPRRWFSGITGSQTEHGVGNDTKTYSDDGEVDRHFMHLSFFAPGKNLHNNEFDSGAGNLVGGKVLYGANSYAANLQGIWGGGHFTGSIADETFGTGTVKHLHLAMEGNNAADGSFLPGTPGPGVGYGYNIKYKELHERQWDPTFCGLVGEDLDPDNKIRDFIRNLHAGSQFKFSSDTGKNVYTIKKVVIKKLYNHTSWRNPYNRWVNNSLTGEQYFVNSSGDDKAYWSVEQAGLYFLDALNDTAGFGGGTEAATFKNAIWNFGKASNRRLCYIIELDENPFTSGFPASNTFTADFNNDEFANIEFLEPVQSILLSDLSKFPAIWEVDPRKKEVDLDIYYEASNNIPVRINNNTNELFAPIGCKVEVLDSSITGTSRLMSWDNTIATFDPGFVRGDGVDEIDYTGLSFKFTREDGGFTIVEAGGQELVGEATGYKTDFNFREDIGDTVRVGLSWYNCFSFGNGIESNRIRDDFNEMFIGSGVKASTTTQEIYEEERRKNGLIYSGIYNSNSGVNDLNQFIMAEKSTKDLNPTYGSIQKLFQRRISLIAFCEDRVVSITSNKDAIYNADGNPQLISSSNVLGDANPFVGDYGISKNPESFASESYRAYFTDKQRGAVIRLSKDGLTPISKTGMHDWFRDNLPKHTSLIGTYDSYKEDYNITLTDTIGENIIYDSFFATGEESTSISGGLINRVTNPHVYEGSSLVYPWDVAHGGFDVLPEGNNTFGWGTINQDLFSTTTITNHAVIPYGSLQSYNPGVAVGFGAVTTWTATSDDPAAAGVVVTSTIGANEAIAAFIAQYPQYAEPQVNQTPAVYSTNLSNSGGSIPGRFYKVAWDGLGLDIWGSSAPTHGPYDAYVSSTPRRHMGNSWVTESNPLAHPDMPSWNSESTYPGTMPGVMKEIYYPITNQLQPQTSHAITRGRDTSISGNTPYDYTYGTGDGFHSTSAIVFDRVKDPNNAWVEFRSIGAFDGDLNNAYNTAAGTNEDHDAFFNGDELHIQFKITCYKTVYGGWNDVAFGYNIIAPMLQLMAGNSGQMISSDKFTFSLTGLSYNVNNQNHIYATQRSNVTSHSNLYNSSSTSNWDLSYISSASYGPFDYRSIPFEFQNSAMVQFPSTSVGATIPDAISADGGQFQIMCGASFKFRDDTQQNQDGTWNGTGNGIQEVKVVDDLVIRISNSAAPSTSSSYNNLYGSSDLQYPLWEINEVRAVKGFGVTAPHTGFIPAEIVSSNSGQITDPGSPGIHAIDAVPPYDVPAWTEVNHAWLDAWGQPSGGTHYLHAMTNNVFGNNYSYVAQTGYGQNSDPSQPPTAGNNDKPYVVPQDWGYDSSATTDQAGITLLNLQPLSSAMGSPPTDDTPFLHQYPDNASITNLPNAVGYPGNNPSSNGGGIYGTGYAVQVGPPFDNDYLYVQTASGGSSFITQSIINTPWEDNKWYLVDVEVDYGVWPSGGSSHPNSGTGSEVISVRGVASSSGFSWGTEIDSEEGVGVYRGGAGEESVQLVPVTRTEYGTPRTVLRGIFQFADDSPRSASNALREVFELWVYNVTNGMRIQKIITKKLDYITPTGSAADWTHETSNGPSSQVHAFSKREIYFKGTKLCFDVPANQTDTNHKWVQEFNTANTLPAPEVTPLGWRLNFTVSDNPDFPNNYSLADGMGGFVARTDAGAANSHEGLRFVVYDIGDYEIRFNMHGDFSEIAKLPLSPNTPSLGSWSIEKDGVDYLSQATLVPTSSMSNWTNTSKYADKIVFGQEGFNVGDLRMAISNILLTDETIIFQGGSAGSWNFDGFVTSENNWIYWDVTNFRLTFEGCPTTDPSSTGQLKLINANQWIDKPIARYEKYNIEFTHGITSGKLSIYYFNAEGFGFKIDDININTGTNGSFSQEVTIGDQEWESINPVNSLYAADLKETFVVGAYDDGELVNGWIDNISMTQVFYPMGGGEKTLTFSEDVNGWTSFKSFFPESGVSLSKKYFTMKNGGLFQHYVPMVDGIAGYTDEEANNYNVFYNQPDPFASIIKLVLNNDPSTIKTFNTLNYEGSQAYVINPMDVTKVTIDNAQAWALSTPTASPTEFPDIDGWECTEIKTDLDMGSVVEFIKKEGKWFNYIKGKTVSLSENLDTSRFSVQGIGVASDIITITQ